MQVSPPSNPSAEEIVHFKDLIYSTLLTLKCTSPARAIKGSTIIATVIFNRKGIDLSFIPDVDAEAWVNLFEDLMDQMYIDRLLVRGFPNLSSPFYVWYACPNPPSARKSFGNMNSVSDYWENPEQTKTDDSWTQAKSRSVRSKRPNKPQTSTVSSPIANPFDALRNL